MQTATNFRFNISDMISALVYARVVRPCSKSKTYDEVYLSCLKTTIFPWTSFILVWNISVQNTKRSLKSSTTRSFRNTSWILPILILTVQTSILRSTAKMTSDSKALRKKTAGNRSLAWACSLTHTRSGRDENVSGQPK
mgnify:CR=1 FL=1